MASGRCIDKLASDADPVRRPPDAAFENVSHAAVRARPVSRRLPSPCRRSSSCSAITKRCLKRERAVMMSSTMPSVKYSCSGSPLMFSKRKNGDGRLLGQRRRAGRHDRRDRVMLARGREFFGRQLSLDQEYLNRLRYVLELDAPEIPERKIGPSLSPGDRRLPTSRCRPAPPLPEVARRCSRHRP